MKRAIALIAVIALMFTVGCQGSPEKTVTTESGDNQTYKIGVVLSKTGNYASIGLQEEKALMMEVEELNKKNSGNDSKKLELIVEDDASEPSNASIAISKLINEDEVVAVIGSTSGAATLAMKPKAQEAKVPLIALSSDMKITQSPSSYVYRTAQPDNMTVRMALDYMYKSLIVKFAIIHEESAYGKSGAEELNKKAKGARLSVTSTQSYAPQDTDMTKQLKKIALTAPHAIVVWGSNAGVATVAKNMKEMKLNLPLIASQANANKAFIDLAGANAEGILFPAGKMVVPESADGAQVEVIKSFISKYETKYGEQPNIYAGYAYDAMHILSDALIATQGDLSQLKLNLNKTWGYVGVAGVFTYSATDHDGTKSSDLIMVEIKNGKWTLKNIKLY